MVASVGRAVLKQLSNTGQLVLFVLDAFGAIVLPPYRVKDTFRQMWLAGVRSLPIAGLTACFVGMIMVLHTGDQLQRFGAKAYVAGIAAIALAREMVPAFTAIVVGARVAASMTAELGTMKITEQIDAMQALAVNPIKYLVAPRVIATTVMLPIVTIYADVLGFFGGFLIGVSALNIPPTQYWKNTLDLLYLSDITCGLLKTIFFGAIIGSVGCYFGFKTEGGAEGVGHATTVSVVATLVLVVLFDYILSSWFLYLTTTI